MYKILYIKAIEICSFLLTGILAAVLLSAVTQGIDQRAPYAPSFNPIKKRESVMIPVSYVVPKRGLEPPHLAVLDPKSSVSTNSTTSA